MITEKRSQTLAELKGEEVTLRNRIEQDKATVKDVIDLCRIRRVIVRLESVLLWSILTLILMLSGYKAGIGLGVDGSLYYPNIPNKLEDPAESREQSTPLFRGMNYG